MGSENCVGPPIDADTKTLRRLRSHRLLVVDADPARAQAFARALQRSGATAVAVTTAQAELESVHAIDAEVILVNADEPDACRPVVYTLRRHPRTRWTTVLPLSFAEVWPEGALQPNLAEIASSVSALVTTAMELAVRTKGKLPYETVLEPLGPSRLLRVLGDTGRRLRVVLADDRVRAELELEDGKVGGARAWSAGAEHALSNARALAEVLAMSSASVRVEEREEVALSDWKVSVTAALAAAADVAQRTEAHDASAAGAQAGAGPAQRIMQPTVPQISLADAFATADDPALSGESSQAALPAHTSEPVRPRRASQRPTERQISLAEAFATSDAPQAADDGCGARLAAALERTRGTRAYLLAAAATAVAATLAAAWLVLRPMRSPEGSVRRQAAAAAEARALALTPPELRSEPGPPTAAPNTLTAAPAQQQPSVVSAEPSKPRAVSERVRRRQLAQANRHRRARRYEQAASAYLQVLELSPDHPPAVLGLVRAYVRSKRGPEALHWAHKLVALRPGDRGSLLLLGDAHALDGDAAQAEQAWRRSSQLGSKTARRRLDSR